MDRTSPDVIKGAREIICSLMMDDYTTVGGVDAVENFKVRLTEPLKKIMHLGPAINA